MDRKIRLYNPWWEINRIPVELYSESSFSDFESIEKILAQRKILTILGARQIGKTYVLYSIINYLFKKGIPPQNILFLSMDDRIINLDAAISFYERIILKKNIINSKETYYIFLDEIQLLENWQEDIKHYLEESYPIKFVLASSSINYFRKNNLVLSEKDYQEIQILPLGFSEYLKYKKVNINIPSFSFLNLLDFRTIFEKKLMLMDYFIDMDQHLNDFLLSGGFFQYLREINPIIKTQKIISQVVDLSIFKDIATIYDLDKPSKLKDLILYISRNVGSILQIDFLSKFFGLSFQSIDNFLNYLESSFLIYSIYNLNYDLSKSQFYPRKLYFSDLGIRNSIVGDQSISSDEVNSLVDNAVFTNLIRKKKEFNFDLSYWRKDNFEIDIVMIFNKNIIPIEINYRNPNVKNQERSVLRFLDEVGFDKGIIISKDILDILNTDGKQILIIPAWLFLLIN